MKSLKKLSLATALFAALAGSAIAAPVTYGVDSTHTFPRFSYSHFGYSTQLSSFKNTSGKVVFDAEAKTGSVDISIDTGSGEADQEVVGKSWFNVAAHPKASFVLKGLKSTGANQYEATGQLSIKGQTRELHAPLKLSPQGALTGSFVLKRADFGIGEGMWAKFDVVANEITVNFNLNLK